MKLESPFGIGVRIGVAKDRLPARTERRTAARRGEMLGASARHREHKPNSASDAALHGSTSPLKPAGSSSRIVHVVDLVARAALDRQVGRELRQHLPARPARRDRIGRVAHQHQPAEAPMPRPTPPTPPHSARRRSSGHRTRSRRCSPRTPIRHRSRSRHPPETASTARRPAARAASAAARNAVTPTRFRSGRIVPLRAGTRRGIRRWSGPTSANVLRSPIDTGRTRGPVASMGTRSRA